MFCSHKAQVWVETVIYTLIAFIMIGAVLSFAKPKIEELQDKAIIEQTVNIMEDINSLVLSVVQGGPGNKRIMELGIKKGELRIDGKNDKIVFEMDSRHVYSEPGKDINVGTITAYTEENGKFNIVNLTISYAGEYNITNEKRDDVKTITKSSNSYKLAISNDGENGGVSVINIDVI